MKRSGLLVLLLLAVWSSCGPQTPSPSPASSPSPSGAATQPSSQEALDGPRLAVGGDRRVLQTLSANLDQDAAEEQIIALQDKTNLSLPVTIQIADYDEARKTYYLAWEGQVLASASQPFTINLEDLVGDHTRDLIIDGLDEASHPTLDVFRIVAQSGGLGLTYRNIFSKVSKGGIRIENPVRPESYAQGQNSDMSSSIVLDEPDSASSSPLATVRTTYTWLFQKGEYSSTGVQRFEKNTTGDATLEKLFGGDNRELESFFQGPWLRVSSDRAGFLILFFDTKLREITFASKDAQEVYRWEVSSRYTRSTLSIYGSNDLIDLIKLQMTASIVGADTIEVSSAENPAWTGQYRKLDPSAALVLARQGTVALEQQRPPVGLYKNDKGDEFDFQIPEVRLRLSGVLSVGSVAVFPLGKVTILQLKVASRPGSPGLSRAYSMEAKEETSTSRVVRTLRLQGGNLTSRGWVSDQSEPIRLEQVEGRATNSSR